MRNAFASTVIAQSNTPESFFLSGDLGFMALEGVRDAFGSRFVNVGVAEQNMIGVAAGLAREGMKVIAYSIAPFAYARPFEQIRNDICLGNLPVCIVGNGGGYAYGHMGPTHHALEDCAAMLALGLRVLVPAFDEDLSGQMAEVTAPTYLRLGYDARPKGTTAPAYAPWREILPGKNGVLAALGPLAGVAWGALQELPEAERPAVWAVCEFTAPPAEFLAAVQNKPLFVAEEHVAAGGLGAYLSLHLHGKGVVPSAFSHRHALGYPSGTYGSQNFHRAECGLDAAGILALVKGIAA